MKNEEQDQSQGQQAGGKVGMDATKSQTKQPADFDETVREAEAGRKEGKSGSAGGDSSGQHNNGRGGGK